MFKKYISFSLKTKHFNDRFDCCFFKKIIKKLLEIMSFCCLEWREDHRFLHSSPVLMLFPAKFTAHAHFSHSSCLRMLTWAVLSFLICFNLSTSMLFWRRNFTRASCSKLRKLFLLIQINTLFQQVNNKPQQI